MKQNEPLTVVKPQSHQTGRVQSLNEFLAARFHILFDMAQMLTTLRENTYLTHFEKFDIVFMKTYGGKRNRKTKK